jgi:hypothetical protein
LGRGSGSKEIELFSEGRLRIADVLRLLLAHHVSHLDPAQDHTGRGHTLETKHRSNPPLDGAMILLDAIVQVGTLPDADRLQLPP